MSSIEKIVTRNMRKAWVKIIEDKINKDPPDLEYIIILYKELRYRLTDILKKDSPTRTNIENSLDVDLFSQMIKNDSFNRKDFMKLTSYVFNIILSLGSPKRDDDTKQKMIILLNKIRTKEDIISVIPEFFLYTNICVDWILEDLADMDMNIKKEITKTSL